MSEAAKRQMTLGMIVGNRGFFPDHLARSGHQEMRATLESAGVKVVALTEAESKFGAVETRQEARRCADLFKRHRETIDGIVVTLPNFGDERAIADTLRMAELAVPVLVQATPDTPGRMSIRDRRDSFCGGCASARSARGLRLSIPCATVKRSSKLTPSPSKPSTFLKFLAASPE